MKDHSNPKYIVGIDEGDGSKSGGVMVIIKNGEYYWHTRNLRKGRIFIWFLRLFRRVKVITETNRPKQ